MTSDLFLCAILLRSLRQEDLIGPPPLQRLQADSVHLIQQHRQEARLHAAWRLTVGPRADQGVDLVEEQDAGGAGPGLAKQLHGGKDGCRCFVDAAGGHGRSVGRTRGEKKST